MMQPPYSRYAAIYDRTGQHRFGADMAELTLRWLARRNISPATALDLATGTGSAALALARHGIGTVGVDCSTAMLDRAREKAAIEGLDLAWQQGDMRAFTVSEPVDLVTCFFDSLNYLLETDDLLRCFSSVSDALRPGGWFIFDINPIHRYATDWNGSSDIAWSDDDLLCLFRAEFDAATQRSPLVLTVFERVQPESDLWRRWEETHIERGYPLQQVTELLAEVGLDVVECRELDEKSMKLMGEATENAMRAVYFVQKPCVDSKIPE